VRVCVRECVCVCVRVCMCVFMGLSRFTRVTTQRHTYDRRNSNHTNASCHTYECVVMLQMCMFHVFHVFHVTHTNASCHTYEGVMSYT